MVQYQYCCWFLSTLSTISLKKSLSTSSWATANPVSLNSFLVLSKVMVMPTVVTTVPFSPLSPMDFQVSVSMYLVLSGFIHDPSTDSAFVSSFTVSNLEKEKKKLLSAP